MYEIIKSVINSGIYELSNLITKIETVWLESRITDEQKNELIQLARENADLSFSIDMKEQLVRIDKDMKTLEARVAKLEEGGSEPITPEEYPQYKYGKWYYNGDKITFNGEKYTCIAPKGQVCVWSPKGYPYWQKVE